MEVNLTLEDPSPDKPTDLSSAVRLFKIQNKRGTTLIVSDFGAAVVSLLVADSTGKIQDIVLGYEHASEYSTDEFYIGTVVGRYANRIGGDTVFIDQTAYKISVKEGGYHHHGGVTGFNKKVFSAAPFQNDTNSGVIFTYTSPHLEEGFPGELRLEVLYTLDDENAWTVEYMGMSTATTLLNLTQHTYFNLTGDPGKSVDEHELQILSHHYLPVNNLQLPTGELADVSGTPFDFTKSKKIGIDLFADDEQLKLSNGYDHSYVLEKQHTALLKHAAIVKEPISGRRMDVYTTEPSIHFYTGNFLKNVRGKNNVIYNERAGFCLETQHFPDAPNHPHFPSTVLQAGQDFYSKTIFKFSICE